MKLKRSIVSVVSLAAVMLAAGCSNEAEPAAGPSDVAGPFAGVWGVDEPQQPSITINGDGTFNGTDGCNTLSGTGEVVEDTFEFGVFAMTKMACQDVDTWLSAASSATVFGDVLKVLSQDGTEIGTLDKQE